MLSLFHLLLTTPLPPSPPHTSLSFSMTWPWTSGHETHPLKLTHAGPTVTCPSIRAPQEVSAPHSLGFFPYPDLSLSLCLTMMTTTTTMMTTRTVTKPMVAATKVTMVTKTRILSMSQLVHPSMLSRK